MFHQTIQCVDLERNQIDSMEEINHLESIDKLEYLSLSFNPIMVLKENRRLIVSKFDRVLCLGEYTRMQ